jgi:hypothetical protein
MSYIYKLYFISYEIESVYLNDDTIDFTEQSQSRPGEM